MVDIVVGTFLYVQSGDSIGHEVHVDDVHSVSGSERQDAQTGEKDESSYHIELRGGCPAAIAQDNAGAKNGFGDFRQQLADHVLAEFLSASVRIIVRTIPVNGFVLGHYFVLSLSGNRDRAYMTKAPHTVVVVDLRRQLNNFQRAPQVYV